jgi:acylphosphatase
MNERLEAVVSGRVQLVMYRDFASRKARGLGLAGEVQNLRDGTVRVVAEGERGALEKFSEKLQRGSLLSRVDHVTLAYKPATGKYQTFDITYG